MFRTRCFRPSLSLLVFGVGALGCGDSPSEPGETTATVVVTAASSTFLPVGGTVQLTANALDVAGNEISGNAFSWSSADDGIATVSASGLVSAVANGSATITATTDGISGTAAIDVAEFDLQISALIDGRSWLILSGETAQWHHLDFAAPGRHDGQDEPTMINGVSWFPTWPNVGENRDCDCTSDVFEGVDAPVPASAGEPGFSIRSEARGITQLRSSTDYPGALVLEFDDNPYGGAVFYAVTLFWNRP